MSERTLIAVVSDLIKSGLTVEQQILVNELALVVADAQRAADRRRSERERKRAYRESVPGQSRDKRKEPKENNILNISQGGSRGKMSRDIPAEPLFDQFWAVYPLKVGKGAARKAFRHANARASAEEIIAGARRYAASKLDPKFTKHPSTWLNADCWLDEPAKNNVVSLRPRWTDVRYDYEQKYGADAFKKYNEDLERDSG